MRSVKLLYSYVYLYKCVCMCVYESKTNEFNDASFVNVLIEFETIEHGLYFMSLHSQNAFLDNFSHTFQIQSIQMSVFSLIVSTVYYY